MFPRIVDLGPIELFGRTFHPALNTYGLLVALGFLVGLWFAGRRAHHYGIKKQDVYDLGVWLIVGAFLGAKVLLILVDPQAFLQNPAGIIRSFGVFFGGFLGAAAASIWFFRRRGIPVFDGADLLAPSIALGHGVGRLGCFAAGCCYGSPTDGPLAVTFHDLHAHEFTGVPLGIDLHPTQLYEAGAEFGLCLFLLWFASRQKFRGQLFFLWLGLYSVFRFSVEFLRGDPRGFLLDGLLSTSQFLSLLLLPVAVVALLMLRRRHA